LPLGTARRSPDAVAVALTAQEYDLEAAVERLERLNNFTSF